MRKHGKLIHMKTVFLYFENPSVHHWRILGFKRCSAASRWIPKNGKEIRISNASRSCCGYVGDKISQIAGAVWSRLGVRLIVILDA
jgi:hypothetical protein